MSVQNEDVWDVLLTAGLVQGDKPDLREPDSPWYIKCLLAISGWLASLFLLGFLSIGFEFIFQNIAVSLFVGSIMIGVSYALLRIPKNTFFEHVALAISFAGQVLVAFAIFDNSRDSINWVWIAIFQFALAIVMPNFVHRVFSSFAAACSFSIALVVFDVPYIASSIILMASVWLWLTEFCCVKHMEKQRAIGYGLVLALILIKGTAVFGVDVMDGYAGSTALNMGVQLWWVNEILLAAVTFYVVVHILNQLGRELFEPMSIAALIGSLLVVIVSAEAQGIAVGMLIVLLGFSGSNRVLMGVGITSLLFFISSYYYLLDYTLLRKSQTLLIVGIVLLVSKSIVQKIGEVTHD